MLLLPTLAVAAPRVSTDYTLNPEGGVGGIPRAAGGNYSADHAADPSGGAVAVASNYTHRPGYIGQLYDVAALAVVAATPSVPEGATNALNAETVMDDDTTLPLAPTEVAWSVAGGPLAGVDPNDGASNSGASASSTRPRCKMTPRWGREASRSFRPSLPHLREPTAQA